MCIDLQKYCSVLTATNYRVITNNVTHKNYNHIMHACMHKEKCVFNFCVAITFLSGWLPLPR
jgi:hypothetical protein